MEENFKKSLREVYEVLAYSESNIVEKIPIKLLNYIKNNMSDDVEVNSELYQSDNKKQISQDARAILALIYRDYLTSDDNREKLLKKEQEEIEAYKSVLEEKYNPDNIFNKEKEQKDVTNNEVQLIDIKKMAWYKRFFSKIKYFFKRK